MVNQKSEQYEASISPPPLVSDEKVSKKSVSIHKDLHKFIFFMLLHRAPRRHLRSVWALPARLSDPPVGARDVGYVLRTSFTKLTSWFNFYINAYINVEM